MVKVAAPVCIQARHIWQKGLIAPAWAQKIVSNFTGHYWRGER